MKANPFTLTVGGLVLLVFASLLFSFQVRQTDIALVTTFGKPTTPYTEPGLKFRWPWPIQQVLKFDKRTQNFEGKFKESYTQDRINVLVSVFAGWSISDPAMFRERFGGSLIEARNALDGMIENAKSAVVGGHPFAHLVSTDPQQLKFDELEKEILALVAPQAKSRYGIDVKFVGIKRVGLPESGTQAELNNMKAERQRIVATTLAQGDNQATLIRSQAELERSKLLAEADAKVIEIQGQANLAATRSLEVFKQEPELGLLLLKQKALIEVLKDRTTLILDQRTPPLDLLDASPVKAQK
jgi:membrane protease subunit HflC